jgi:hypothetical protein
VFYRLGGEVRHQLDLLVGEGPHFLAVDGDRADNLALLEHRHRNMRSRAGEFGRGGLHRFRRLVDGVDDLPGLQKGVERETGVRPEWPPLPQEIGKGWRRT